MTDYDPALFHKDVERTLQNRERLFANRNLMKWYGALYEQMFRSCSAPGDLKILEIGSGTSPIREFYPSVLTSDILPLPHLDFVLDCMKIDESKEIKDHSLDVITFTNVLHHLPDPIAFLLRASKKLKKTGRLLFAEPFMSFFMYPVFKYIHYEPADLSVTEPILDGKSGPLSGANQALPHLIFLKRRNWLEKLKDAYDLDSIHYSYFTSLSYFLTGGIDQKFSIPAPLYDLCFAFDRLPGKLLPRFFASFFICEMNIARFDKKK